MWGNAFILAIRQICRNPMRSLLTVLGVVIGVAAVITMVTVGNGATQAVREQIESLGSNQLMIRPGQRMGPGGASGAPTFKLEDIDAIANQIAGIKAVAPQRQQSMTVVAQGRNWSTQVIGSSNQYFVLDNRGLALGRYFETQEEQSGAAVCIIGTTIQKEIFSSTNPVGQMLRTGNFSCRVVGVLESKGQAAIGGDQDDLVVMPIKTFQRRVSGNTRVSAILVSVDTQIDRAMLTESLRALMRERRSLSDTDEDNFMYNRDHDDAFGGGGCCQSHCGRDRHYEYHACECDRAYTRNRCTTGHRSSGARSLDAISD